MALKFETTEWC